MAKTSAMHSMRPGSLSKRVDGSMHVLSRVLHATGGIVRNTLGSHDKLMTFS